MGFEEDTHSTLGSGRGKRGARSKESSRRAAAFRLDHAANRVFRTWNLEQGGSTQAAARFKQYRNSQPLSLVNTTRLHDDTLTSELCTWTSQLHARTQHQSLRQDEHTFSINHNKRERVPRLGSLPQTRPDGVIRFMYCQLNGIAGKARQEEKLTQLVDLSRKHDIDVAALCEIGINWSQMPHRKSFSLAHMLNSKLDREVRAVTSHNRHGPHRSRGQYGGTGIVLFNTAIQYAQNTAHDHRQLGRWASWVLSNSPLHRTRVVVAYCPGKSRREGLKTVYQQHLRYLQNHRLQLTPYQLFVDDLVKQVTSWIKSGERILLFMDANEHITNGLIHAKLTDKDVGLQEISHRTWGATPPHTHINGSIPIDGIFASPELEMTHCLHLSFHESVGDHRTMIVEISTRSLLGQHQSSIVRPTTRRLTTKQPRSVSQYNSCFLEQCHSHRIRERTTLLISAVGAEQYPVSDSTSTMIMRLHTQMDEIRARSEKDCRKILKPCVSFSPVIAFWNDKIHAYQQLLKIKDGSHPGINRGRAYRTAVRKNIPIPWALSPADCKEGIRLAKIRQAELRKHADEHRKQHLRSRLQQAIDNDNEPMQKNIRNCLRRESSKLAWRRINRVSRPATGRSCLQAQEEIQGELITHTTKAEVEGAIQRECEERFRLGHGAPIKSSLLGEEVGYLSDTKVAQDIIMGSYVIPEDMEEGTALLLTEIGKVGRMVQESGPPQHLHVTATDYQRYWSRLNENTSSSFSGFHLGHHMSAAKSDEMSELLSDQMNLIVSSGVCPSRWGVALQILLEKIAGVSLVSKLRSIQLYEADYNWFNKLIFNDQALASLRATGLMPEEHFSQKQSLAEDACFDKILTLDLSRQSRLPMALVSIDAAQCYDRVNHLIMSLVWLALGVQQSAISIILKCLQDMTIFTRTGFGDSTAFFGGPNQLVPFCGLGQGSKAAPASWLQLSTMIINAFKQQGHGALFVDPITKSKSHSIGCVYVDDTDIYTAGPHLQSVEQVIQETSRAVPCWSRCLSATGGAIKAPKSGWHLIAYKNVDGKWVEREVPWDLVVPLPAPEGATILKQHKVTEAIKSLGVFTAPRIGHEEHLKYIRGKVEDWLIKMSNGHLPAALTWMSYQHQLWAGVRYALGTLTNTFRDADNCLDSTDYKTLSLLGVNRHIKKGWRRLPHTFGGIGLLALPIEQHICRVNLFCQHFGSTSTLGLKLSTSLHWLQLQLGCTGNPLLLDYSAWGQLATPAWITSFWEGLHCFPGALNILFDSISLQRDNDIPLMQLAFASGLRGEDLVVFNRCRCAGHLLFLSDIMTADGTTPDKQYTKGEFIPLLSRFDFPPEHPTQGDWSQWSRFWDIVGDVPRLGGWTSKPHFQWPWILSNDKKALYEATHNGWRTYLPLAGRTRSGTGFVLSGSLPTEPTGEWVSVKHLYSYGRTVTIVSHQGPAPPLPPPPHNTIWDLLQSWGGDWMWSSLHLPDQLNDMTWLVQAIEQGSLVGCTDGSYNGKRSTNHSSAGWILHDITSGTRVAGSFCEFSPGASSYRGEMLGLCALQLFLLAVDKWYSPRISHTMIIYCDNEKAGERAQEVHRRVKPGWSCSDVLRSFRETKRTLRIPIQFTHVSAHMDEVLPWEQLSLAEQLNCMCDTLAKEALDKGIREISSPTSNMLPRELVAVFFSDGKATSDPADMLRVELGHREARHFLTHEMGWTPRQFDLIAWKHLHATLLTKPLAFRLWLAKQHSGFCATGMMMKRCKMSEDDRCPSCWRRKERAEHLCKCPSAARSALLEESVRDLEQWMEKDNNTDPELRYWVPKYIRGRGQIGFCELGRMSSDVGEVARDQDTIGWRNFMEGRICLKFKDIQHAHLSSSASLLNTDMWMRMFISKLLHITHSQWILRNFMLHDTAAGFLRLKDRLELITKIAELSSTNPNDLPEESRFLLEIDTNRLAEGDFDDQDYWVHAMDAAIAAKQQPLSVSPAQQMMRTGPALGKTGKFLLLEEIRKERSLRPGHTALNRGKGKVTQGLQARESEAHRMATLASNRRRKPD